MFLYLRPKYLWIFTTTGSYNMAYGNESYFNQEGRVDQLIHHRASEGDNRRQRGGSIRSASDQRSHRYLSNNALVQHGRVGRPVVRRRQDQYLGHGSVGARDAERVRRRR